MLRPSKRLKLHRVVTIVVLTILQSINQSIVALVSGSVVWRVSTTDTVISSRLESICKVRWSISSVVPLIADTHYHIVTAFEVIVKEGGPTTDSIPPASGLRDRSRFRIRN
jgi:4-hydroxy-3-methylbut-2-en-1-yl diphosphate synthase IspG/GcpE